MKKTADPFLSILQPTDNAETRTERPYIERQAQVYRMGHRLERGESLSDDERVYLGKALMAIAEGTDPYKALDLETNKPGQRRSSGFVAHNAREAAVGWIAAVIKPGEDGTPALKVGDAIKTAAEKFGYEEGTMKKIWNESARDPVFKLL